MATTDRPTDSTPESSTPTTDAVERWKNSGVILPDHVGEIAAYLARRRRE